MRHIFSFREIDSDDKDIVGSYASHLGELARDGCEIPPGFILSSDAYFQYLHDNHLSTKITHLLSTIHFERPDSLQQVAKQIQRLIREGSIDEVLVKEIFTAYQRLGGTLIDIPVTLHTEVLSRHPLPQQKSLTTVSGETNVLLAIKEAWASLFQEKALLERHHFGIDHFQCGVAITVQEEIQADVTGVVFTTQPITGDKSTITIEAMYGLPAIRKQGVTPDIYELAKDTFRITASKVSLQTVALRRSGAEVKEVLLTQKEGSQRKLTDQQLVRLATLGKKLENHFLSPQEIQFAVKGEVISILSSRPLVTIKPEPITQRSNPTRLPLLGKGFPLSPGIATGEAVLIQNASDLSRVRKGCILVIPHFSNEFLRMMKKVSGVIIEQRTEARKDMLECRHLGIPVVSGISNAKKIIRPGTLLTIHGENGEVATGGYLPTKPAGESTKHSETTATKVYVNLSEKELLSESVLYEADGIGLLRGEHLISTLGVHPKKVIHEGKQKEFVSSLAAEIATFCESFTPRSVIYRLSDGVSSEYKKLVGGKEFETTEENPLLGYHGAYRLLTEKEVTEMELQALKEVRTKYELKNLSVMIPYVRSVKEVMEMKKLLTSSQLYRSPSFKLWISVGIPRMMLSLETYLSIGVDGVAIDAETLSQLLLGTDLHDSEVSHLTTPDDEALLWAYSQVIKTARKYETQTTIYGSTLSADMLDFLVKDGISSVTVLPKQLEFTKTQIAKIEQNLLSLGR